MEDFNINDIHIEQDFWDDFISEAFEHIEEIETNAMSLEQNPENMDIIHTMFRAFHTIKGLAGFVEHVLIQELAHKTETMMDYCRKGELKVSTDIVNAILKTADFIKHFCEDIDAYKEDGIVEKIKAHLAVLESLSNSAEENPFTGSIDTSNAAPETPAEPVAEAPAEPVAETPTSSVDEIEILPATEEPIFAGEVPAEPVAETSTPVEDASAKEETPEEGLAAFASEINVFEDAEKEEVSTTESAPEPEMPAETAAPVQEPVAETPVPAPTPAPVVEPVAETPAPAPIPTPVAEPVAPAEPVFATPTPAPAPAPAPVQEPEPVVESEQVSKSPDEIQRETARSLMRKNILKKLTANVVGQYGKEVPEAAQKHASSEEYMKVASYRIDHLVDIIGELIINQALIEQYVNSNYSDDKQLVANMSGFLRTTRELQNLSMSLRMVALKPTFQKLLRIARDTIQQLNKNVEFVFSGENTEIDRAVAEKLLEPLVHMIKNAISHGVEENEADRIAAGKPAKAKVELNAYSKRGKIFIEVKDDGRGINTQVVYQKALEKGMIDPNRTYTDAEIREFIMLPGFSTAKVVDNISGRGVGMDVVKNQIQKTGGKVDIQSALGVGSTFILEVPVNHAIMNGTIIEMNNQHFVVPTVNVSEFLQPKPDQWIFTKQERTMIKVRDNIIPMVPMATFFEDVKEPENVPLVMVLELDQELRAVPIVNVISRQEVVVKPVGDEFKHLKYVSGMSILGTGKVSLILDIDYLFKKEIIE